MISSLFGFRSFTLLVIGFFIVCVAAPCLAAVVDQGEYIDAGGAHHPWHVNDAHALIWGGQPFLPVGGMFQPRYLSEGQTDANWQADSADLATLKQHGVTTLILIGAGDGGLLAAPAAALQRVLDALDKSGFIYGIDINSFPRDALEASVVDPAIYRVPAPEQGGSVTFRNIGDLVGATWFLVSSSDASVITSGQASIADAQTATVTLAPTEGGSGTVLLLYPIRVLAPDTFAGKHLPDIWTNADSYRDALLSYLHHVKLGAGFRFFLDPIVDSVGLFGDADGGMVPDSKAYQLAWRIWLLSHYDHNLARLNLAWGIKNEDVADFEVAARSVPLWFHAKGLQAILDPKTNKTYDVVTARSSVWQDIRAFREDSLRQAMDGLADALKNGNSDAPVIYRWSEPSELFVEHSTKSGFDGLLVDSHAEGPDLVTSAAGYAYAEAEQAGKNSVARGGD